MACQCVCDFEAVISQGLTILIVSYKKHLWQLSIDRNFVKKSLMSDVISTHLEILSFATTL